MPTFTSNRDCNCLSFQKTKLYCSHI
ncbi:SWIM zinc finger family protein [Polynucleobacter sp. MWH-UH23A]